MKACDFVNKFLTIAISRSSGTNMLQNKASLAGLIEGGLSQLYHLHAKGQNNTESWMIKSEAFPTVYGEMYLQTKYPIIDIKNFYCGRMPKRKFKEANCDCSTCPETCDSCDCDCSDTPVMVTVNSCDCYVGVSCDCDYTCKPLKVSELSAKAKPCKNSYQVIGGENNGGYRGQIIGLYIPQDCADCEHKDCESIYVEYYAGYNPIECDLQSEIELPNHMYPVLAKLILSDFFDYSSTSDENKSANMYTKSKDLLYSQKDADTRSNNKSCIRLPGMLGMQRSQCSFKKNCNSCNS